MKLHPFRLIMSAAIIGITARGAIDSARGQTAATPPPPVAPKPAPWDVSAAAGLTLTRGNSSTLTATANILGQKKWDLNELSLGADATYGTDHGTRNAESLHGFAQYNRLFTDRVYGYARVDGLHDAVADLKYRVTLSPGAGYYFIKETNTTLSGEVGPGVIFERQGTNDHTYMALRLAEKFEHKFSDRVRVWQSLEFLPQVDKFDNWILNAEVGVETKMSAKLALRVFALDTYDNQPAPGRKKNDLKLVTALAYHF